MPQADFLVHPARWWLPRSRVRAHAAGGAARRADRRDGHARRAQGPHGPDSAPWRARGRRVDRRRVRVAPWLLGGRWQLPPHLAPGLGLGVLPILLVSMLDDIRSVGARCKAPRPHCSAPSSPSRLGISLGTGGAPVRRADRHRLACRAALGALDRRRHECLQHHRRARRALGRPGADCRRRAWPPSSRSSASRTWPASRWCSPARCADFFPTTSIPRACSSATPVRPPLASAWRRSRSRAARRSPAGSPRCSRSSSSACRSPTRSSPWRGERFSRLEHHTGGVFVPDRNHIHHRLLALGIDHGRAVLILLCRRLDLRRRGVLLDVPERTRGRALRGRAAARRLRRRPAGSATTSSRSSGAARS